MLYSGKVKKAFYAKLWRMYHSGVPSTLFLKIESEVELACSVATAQSSNKLNNPMQHYSKNEHQIFTY